MTDTLLIISPIGVPLYSARGLTQELTPIQAATQLKRTVNGGLEDLSFSQFHKYATKITAHDQRPPAVDGIFPGAEVTIYCVAELAFLTHGGTPARSVMSGSEYVEGNFTFYRPVLDCRISKIEIQRDEYGATVQWTLEAEEI